MKHQHPRGPLTRAFRGPPVSPATFVLVAAFTVPAAARAEAPGSPPSPGTAAPAPGTSGTGGTAAAGVVRPAPGAAELLDRLRDRVARPGGLTSDYVARRAVETSNEDRARAADVESAAADVTRAKVGYYPKLTLTARYTRLSPISPPALGTAAVPADQTLSAGTPLAGQQLVAFPLSFPVVLDNYMLQANLTVPLSDYFLRIRQTHDAALSAEEAQAITREASRRSVAAQARLLYYSWARVRLQEAVTEQSVEQAERHLELARAGRDAGRMPEVEVLRAESAVASAELLHQRTKDAATVAEERLHTLLHVQGAAPYRIGEDLLAPLPPEPLPSAEALYAEALQQRPEMRAFERTEASLRSERAATESMGVPRLDAFANGYVANPSPRIIPQQEQWKATWDVGVQLTWSPNDLGGSDASTRAIDARRQKVDAERAAVKDALRDEIHAAVVATRDAAAAADTARRGLSAAEESYRVRRELFELGRATDVELIDAETDVLRARLEMIQARVDARVARVQLDHAVGRDATSGR